MMTTNHPLPMYPMTYIAHNIALHEAGHQVAMETR